MPLYCGRVVRRGEHRAGGVAGDPDAKYRRSVEASPMSTTSTPWRAHAVG